MTTELKEARIKVVLDLSESKGEAKELDKSVEKTARKQKKVGEDAKEAQTGRGPVSSRRIAIRQLAGGSLFSAVTSILKSVPLIGIGFAAGISAAELNERFGPGLAAMIEGLLPGAVVKALDVAGIDLEASAEMSRKWSETKAVLSSLSQAFDRTVQIAAATNLTGGSISPAEAKAEFGLQREMAKFQTEMLKARRRILQIEGGKGVSNAIKGALEQASLPSSVGK